MNTKYTLVTGATGGLGNAFCRELLKLNKNLILTGTKQEKLDKWKNTLLEEFKGQDIEVFPCDLSSKSSRDKLFEYITENKFEIEMLINNAGYITEGSIKHANSDTLLKCIQVNCEGVIDLTKFILDNKKTDGQLNIITISSMAGDCPMPYMAIYSATKAFESNFMTSLRLEYKKENVKVLVVKPGAIATSQEMIDAIKAQGLKGKLSAVPADKIAKNSIKKSLKGKKQYIPGFFNKLTSFASLFATKNYQAKVVAKIWKKSQEKRDIE